MEIVWGQGLWQNRKDVYWQNKKGDTTEDIVDTTEHPKKIPRKIPQHSHRTVLNIDCAARKDTIW